METWKLLAGTCLLLVLWGVLVSALGFTPGPWALILGTASGMLGFYFSMRLTMRFIDDENQSDAQ